MCKKTVQVAPDSLGNLKIHRDGYVSSTVKGGLEELGRAAPSRAQEREEQLGIFPFSGTLPVIDEEDEDLADNTPLTAILIDLPDSENNDNAPEEAETDHDSEYGEFLDASPEYDEDNENQKDNPDPTTEISLENSSSNKYHTTGSRKKANRSNSLINKLGGVTSQERQRVWA
ncbi:uncharacterized protein MELLADRAFT_112267 [Melampsora larici-populina 98AG31]|uniref:Uncharacterized protein n=1 Tax=Melampsora larici-populina (strain 98AG31 / pathotype 3-4-7) TaxID=747676 RepID=F4S5X9_MELLP|nr:uncharacterized protein MELLADRAFT_112267 [Melampsora larici-populina 98AG31]EGF99981.1 hypothetical protein MELLADRAFT_112267 [Melampsora larici-populina 98AG31]